MKIIIPAYQPDNRLIKLIDEIQESSKYEIILINDGSDEKCNPVFEAAMGKGCTVLIHKTNKGKGASLKSAFTYLLESNAQEGFICADCDGQHTCADIKKLADVIPLHPSCIVLGCRKFIGKVPFRSMLGNKITRTIFSLITGTKIMDTQTGLRGFSSSMLPWLVQLEGNRYEYEMNQLLNAKKSGYSFHCVPIDTIYENNNAGSHFRPITDSIRIYLPIIKFSMSSVTSGILDFGLLFLFKGLTGNLLFAVVSARIISSLCNYLLNKHLVFDAKSGKKASSLLQYYLLAATILGFNYLLLSLFHETIGISLFFSKLLTELFLFIISFNVQHKIIFRKKQHNPMKLKNPNTNV